MHYLKAINRIVEDTHPGVSNPYTLLTTAHQRFLLVYCIGSEGCLGVCLFVLHTLEI